MPGTWARRSCTRSGHASSRGSAPRTTSLGNPRFALAHALQADQLANGYLTRAIEGAGRIGAVGLAGECWLALAELHETKDRTVEAWRCYGVAFERFSACGAAGYVSRVASALKALAAREGETQ